MTKSLRSEARAAPAKQSRNAFMHFLKSYRQKYVRPGTPAWVIASRAGQVWSKMPLNDKYCFIAAARRSSYTYKSRHRELNRSIRHLRNAMASDTILDLGHLSAAVEYLQSWKNTVTKGIC